MKIFIYDESRALIRTVGTPDVMQGENNATLIFMSVAGIDESNFHDYMAQFAATVGTSHAADVITDFGPYVLDGATYYGWKYFVSSKFTQAAGVLNANLVLSSGGSTLISQTVSLNVNPSASGVTWFKGITQAQWEQLLAYCVGLRNPNLGALPDEGGLDQYCNEGQAGAYLYVDGGGISHLLFIGYDEAQDRVCQTDYYNDNGALLCRQRYTAEGDADAWGNWAVNSQASAISFDDSKSEMLAGKNTVQKALEWLGKSIRPINFVPSLSATGFTVVDGLDPKDKKIKDANGNNLDATGIKEYSYRKFGGNQNAISTGKAVLFTDDGSIYELIVEETVVAYHFDGSAAELVAQAKSEQSAINQTLTNGIATNDGLIKNNVVGNSAMAMDPSTYVITLTNTNLNGVVLSTYSVDIPAEMAFVSGRYDAESKDLIFTLQNGSEVAVPVDDIFVGLATQDWVNAAITDALEPYATSSWVNSAITDALIPYATSSWVDSNYVSLTKGGYVSMAEAPASAGAYYFGAENGSTSFLRLADNSFGAKTTKGDVAMMFSLNYSSSNLARFVKIDSSTSPATVSTTDVPFKNGIHSLAFEDDLAETNIRVAALESKTAKNESDIRYLYRQVIGGGDLVTVTDSGVASTSQPFPLTVSPKALLDYVGGMCQKVNQLVPDGNFASGVSWFSTFGSKTFANHVITYQVESVGDDFQNRIYREANNGLDTVNGNKYLVMAVCKPLTRNYSFYVRAYGSAISFDASLGSLNQGVKATLSAISTATRTEKCEIRLCFGSSGKAIGDEIEVYQVAVANLTAIYGAGNEPTSTSDARVQWLISYFTEHPEYDTGSILTAPVTGVNVYSPTADYTVLNVGDKVAYFYLEKNADEYQVAFTFEEKGEKGFYALRYNKNTPAWWVAQVNDMNVVLSWDKEVSLEVGKVYSVLDIFQFMFGTIKSANTSGYVKNATSVSTLPIPVEVQALDGYGLGIDGTLYNYIDFERKKFVKKVKNSKIGDLPFASFSAREKCNCIEFTTDKTTRQNGGTIGNSALSDKFVYSTNGWVDPIVLDSFMWMPDKTTIRFTLGLEYNTQEKAMAYVANHEIVYGLAAPVETDISQYLDRDLPNNDVIEVSAGGYLEFENENSMGVPYSVTYQSKQETQGGE